MEKYHSSTQGIGCFNGPASWPPLLLKYLVRGY